MIRTTLPAAALGSALGAAGRRRRTAPELSYGAAVTSNYIYKGTTQSDDKPALQGYVEAAYGMFYGGVWSSTVDSGDRFGTTTSSSTSTPACGPTFGDLSVDLSYFRYLYDDSGDCCGEFILNLGYPMADFGELEAEFDYDPVEDTKWASSGAVGRASWPTYSVGGTVGTDFGTLDLGKDDKVAWDVGRARGRSATSRRWTCATTIRTTKPRAAVLSIAVDF